LTNGFLEGDFLYGSHRRFGRIAIYKFRNPRALIDKGRGMMTTNAESGPAVQIQDGVSIATAEDSY